MKICIYPIEIFFANQQQCGHASTIVFHWPYSVTGHSDQFLVEILPKSEKNEQPFFEKIITYKLLNFNFFLVLTFLHILFHGDSYKYWRPMCKRTKCFVDE